MSFLDFCGRDGWFVVLLYSFKSPGSLSLVLSRGDCCSCDTLCIPRLLSWRSSLFISVMFFWHSLITFFYYENFSGKQRNGTWSQKNVNQKAVDQWEPNPHFRFNEEFISHWAINIFTISLHNWRLSDLLLTFWKAQISLKVCSACFELSFVFVLVRMSSKTVTKSFFCLPEELEKLLRIVVKKSHY